MMIRADFVITKEKDVVEFLKLFGNKIEIFKSDLVNAAHEKKMPLGASFEKKYVDCKSLKLMANGDGRCAITDLGRRIVSYPNDRVLWKEAYLNVPAYAEFYKLYPDNKDYDYFNQYFYKKGVPENLKRLFGMGVRRYFEGYYGMELPPRISKPERRIRRGRRRVEHPHQATLEQSGLFKHETNGLLPNIDEDVIMFHRYYHRLKQKYSEASIQKLIEK